MGGDVRVRTEGGEDGEAVRSEVEEGNDDQTKLTTARERDPQNDSRHHHSIPTNKPSPFLLLAMSDHNMSRDIKHMRDTFHEHRHSS